MSNDTGMAAAWQQLADEATQRRNDAIRDAYREGASLRDIAAVVGLSRESVRRIVEGMSA